MFVEELALHRGEVKAQFSLLQDGGSPFLGLSFQGFGHPGEGFFQFGGFGLCRCILTHGRIVYLDGG